MGEWIETLKNEMGVYWEILFLVLGAVLGIIIPNWIENYKKFQKSRIIKKRIKSLSSNEDLNILTLASANNFYLPRNLDVRFRNKRYYLGFPQELREQVLKVDAHFEMNEDFIFGEKKTLKVLGEKMGIEDFEERVERHRNLVAQNFIEQTNGCYNNREKFGVYSFRVNHAADKDENAGVIFELYDTDYYTHRIMRSIYNELKNEGHPISKIQLENSRELMKYNVFTTSIGINMYLIMDSENGEDVIFSQRAAYAAHEESRFKYNSTVMEGVSQSDFDLKAKAQDRVSLLNSAKRGLEEELGLSTDEISIKFHDVFLQKDFFEIGVTATAKLTEDMALFEECVRDLPAKDKDLEVARLIPVPFNTKKISNFVCNHEMYSQGLYTLRMIAARHGVKVLHKK